MGFETLPPDAFRCRPVRVSRRSSPKSWLGGELWSEVERALCFGSTGFGKLTEVSG